MKLSAFRILVISCVITGLLSIGAACHARNVNRALHPNLAAAQELIDKAINRISMAQRANEFDMNGHAAKAKALLDQAYTEIKLAAMTSNMNR